MKLEVCAANIASAITAETGGADRIELCSALPLGGLTPGPGLILEAVRLLTIPVFPLIRTREGHFTYSKAEVEAMCADILFCKKAGCAGVVFGALTSDGQPDIPVLEKLLAAAEGIESVHHRAFDFTKNPSDALEILIKMGFSRVLTSGGAPTALEGKSLIIKLLQQSAGRIEIMPGSGIRVATIRQLADETGAKSFHFSASKRVEQPGDGLPGLETSWEETDVKIVRAMRLSLIQNA